jgi:hypothetical protein
MKHLRPINSTQDRETAVVRSSSLVSKLVNGFALPASRCRLSFAPLSLQATKIFQVGSVRRESAEIPVGGVSIKRQYAIDLLIHVCDAFNASWMCGQPLWWSAFGGSAHLLPKRDTRSWIVASAGSKFHAYEIGVAFIPTRELECKQLRPGAQPRLTQVTKP